MQRRSPAFYRKRLAKYQIRFNVNHQIRAPQVMVIDENGENLGLMNTPKAVALSEEQGFDLVEVNPNAAPPVCKIIDYNQFQYEQNKHRQKQKARQKKIALKGVRLSFRISDHDKETRMGQARKFLEQGHKVKIEIVLRGRERGYGDQAKTQMEQFAHTLGNDIFIEQPFSKQGGRISMVIAKRT